MPAGLMRTPRALTVEITARCNLRCRYCYFFNNLAVEYRDLPTSEWLRFFDELGLLGVMNLSLAGGEPFIRDDLPALLEGITRNRMRYSILSNGMLIGDEISRFIAGTGRCEFVQVSVDGSRAEIHDSCRGKGSFDGAIRGIQTLRRHRVPVMVRVTVHRRNLHDLENIARLLLEELQLPGFSTNSAGFLGACRVHAEDVLLSTQERQTAISALLGLSQKYRGRISASAGPLADGLTWRRMANAQAQGAPAFHNGGHLTACGCPSQKIAIRADGKIIPCTMLAHVELGSINQDSLKEIWQDNPTLNQLRARNAVPLTDFEFCAGCAYVPYCTGNCPGLAYALTGNVEHPSPDACLRVFLKNGGMIA